MKTYSRIILIIVVLLLLVSCKSYVSPVSPKHDENNDSDVYIYYADLTHDGTDEKIVVDFSNLETPGYEIVYVYVYDNNGKLLWQDDAGLSHIITIPKGEIIKIIYAYDLDIFLESSYIERQNGQRGWFTTVLAG